MEGKRSSKQSKKVLKRGTSPRKQCINCLIKCLNNIHLSRSLYRKYSYSQNHFYLHKINSIDLDKSQRQSTNDTNDQQFMNRYHKNSSRKVMFNKIKDVYKMHKDIPRIYILGIKDILFKCHHRKRLIEYFKLAKILGIKVESLAFSSFMLSLNLTGKKQSKTYSKLLIDESDSSLIIEKRILAAIGS